MQLKKRQIEILHATAIQISKHGVSNLTTKTIAKSLNVTEPALYRHFSCKNDILENLVNWYAENIQKSFIYAQKKETGLGKIIGFMAHRERLYRRSPELAMLSFNEELYYNDVGLSLQIQDIFASVRDFLLAALSEGQKDKSVTSKLPPEQLYFFVFGAHRLFFSEMSFFKPKSEGKRKSSAKEFLNSVERLLKND